MRRVTCMNNIAVSVPPHLRHENVRLKRENCIIQTMSNFKRFTSRENQLQRKLSLRNYVEKPKRK